MYKAVTLFNKVSFDKMIVLITMNGHLLHSLLMKIQSFIVISQCIN